MRLQFVGCGDAFGSGGRFNTCFHLTGRNINVLIDCGASSLVSMNKLAINRNDVNVIFLTHFHADHVGGVPFYLLGGELRPQARSAADDRRAAQSQIALCRHHGGRIPRHQRSRSADSRCSCQELDIGKRNDVGGLRVTPFHVVHDDRAGPCLGFRFEAEGKVIAFSGDSEWTNSLIDIGYQADLFICEAYTRDKPVATHMALSLLERHLDKIRPKRLILSHMSEDMLARRAEIPYETAEDGMIVEV